MITAIIIALLFGLALALAAAVIGAAFAPRKSIADYSEIGFDPEAGSRL